MTISFLFTRATYLDSPEGAIRTPYLAYTVAGGHKHLGVRQVQSRCGERELRTPVLP